MHPRPPKARPNSRSLALAVMIALLFRGEQLMAEAVSPASLDAETHAQVCKCGSSCRDGSCCCGRSLGPRKESAASLPISSGRPSEPDFRPCLDEAPCGDPALPGSASSVPTSRVASLTLFHHISLQTTSDLL